MQIDNSFFIKLLNLLAIFSERIISSSLKIMYGLKKLYDVLQKKPDISVVMAKVRDFISLDAQDKTTPIKQEPYYGLFTGAVLIRKSVFDKIGLFDENIHTGEIISFKNKLDALNLKMEKLDFVVTNRRVHDTNFGKTHQKKEFQDYASVLRAKLTAKK